MLGEFAREQEKFVSENREKKKQSEAAVPPWVGYNEEETMKSQILALSKVCRQIMAKTMKLFLIFWFALLQTSLFKICK